MYVFVVLLVFVAAASAQRPKPCESPKAWNGRIFQFDRSKNVTVLGKVAYDEYNQRVRMIEEIDITGKRGFYDFIILYQEGLLYRIELSINKTGACTVFEFHQPFKPAQVPADAKFGIEAYIGAAVPGAGVRVNTFYGEAEQQEEKLYYVETVTALGCLPVQSIAYSQKIGAIHSSFYDLELGVDPEHFVPPIGCKPGGSLKHVPFRL